MRPERWLGLALGGLFLAVGLGCGGPAKEVKSPPSPAASAPTASTPVDTLAQDVTLGALRNSDFTVTLRPERMMVDITPLEEEILQYSTEDLRRTYSDLIQQQIALGTFPGDPQEYRLFLVIFRALDQEARYEPTDLNLRSEGSLFRPLQILPVTPNFYLRVLKSYEVAYGIYLYSRAVDLRASITIEYQGLTNSQGWERVRAAWERAKARFRKP